MNTQTQSAFFSAEEAVRHPSSIGATVPYESVNDSRLVGRDGELEVLRAFVRDALTDGATLVVRGAAGSGKSEILEAGAGSAAAAGARILRCTGIRGGRPPELSGLLQVLWPVLGDARRLLTGRQFHALETLLVDGAPAPQDRGRMPFAVLGALEAVSADQPLLIVVDNWDALDEPSRDVLAFVARRTAGRPLGLLMSARPQHTRPASAEGLPELLLHPLPWAQSAALLAKTRPGNDPRTERELLATAAGNPLALLELPTQADHSAPYLPASSDRLAAALAPWTAQLPAGTRDLLLVAALHPTADIPALLSAASRLGGVALDLAAVEPAERQGIVMFDGMRLHFSHPATAGAVVHGTGPRRCRSAHAALAAELKQGSVRHMWHLSQAVEGPDPELAARLEDVHGHALRQNEPGTAVRLLRRAADLYSRPEDQGRCLLRAAQLAYGADWVRMARTLAHHALRLPLGPLGTLCAERLTRLESSPARPADPAAWPTPVGAAEQDSALELAQLVAPTVTKDIERAGALLSFLDRLPDRADDPRLLHAMATAMPLRRSSAVIERLPDALGRGDLPVRDLERLGEAALLAGAPLQALDLQRQAERRCRFHDLHDLMPGVLLRQGLAHLVTGDWGQAERAFRRCGESAEERGHDHHTTAAGLLEQLTRGLRTGTVVSWDDARARDVARRSVAAMDDIVAVSTGWAQVESGDFAAGYTTLARLLAAPAPCTAALFALVPFAEAADAVNAADEARARLRQLERELGPEHAPIVSVGLAVAQAVLAVDQHGAPLYERAFAMDLSHHHFLEASLRLAHGRWLRRRREFSDSRVTLRQAAATFAMIGAEARVARITEELRASGESAGTVTSGASRPAPAAGLLNAQELRIATLAGQGLSNRQIGAECGLSPRTIGSYLYQIFPRLGVTTRAQLATALRNEPVG
ncbi:LuxR family transcriptional regulator [Streptomyces yanii]|uniref:LuxR family transcriptional regulator n=1 Tax=Streptomyces yanii TaxID=78510 RepID=A0ABV5R2N2_9ACTN